MTKQNYKLVLTLLGATALTACGGGGGGGGGGGYTPNNPSPSLVYQRPVAQATVDVFSGSNENSPFVGDTFITDLDGDGANDDIVIAGRETQPESGQHAAGSGGGGPHWRSQPQGPLQDHLGDPPKAGQSDAVWPHRHGQFSRAQCRGV